MSWRRKKTIRELEIIPFSTIKRISAAEKRLINKKYVATWNLCRCANCVISHVQQHQQYSSEHEQNVLIQEQNLNENIMAIDHIFIVQYDCRCMGANETKQKEWGMRYKRSMRLVAQKEHLLFNVQYIEALFFFFQFNFNREW